MSELLKRFLARDAMSPEEEAAALSELEQVLDSDQHHRHHAEGGRKDGAESNSKRSQRHKALWLIEAKRRVTENALLLRDVHELARQILAWCDEQNPQIAMATKPYSERTVYRFLLSEIDQLCAKPDCLSPSVQSQSVLARDEGDKAFPSTVQHVIQSRQ